MMEEVETSRQPVFPILMRRWKLILGLTVAAVAAAAAVNMVTPPTYEASSVVSVAALGTKPAPELKSYLELATSDRLLVELAATPGAAAVGSPPTIEEMRRRLKATAGSDPSLINLRVTGSDPRRSADLARDWTDLFLKRAQETFNPAEDNYDQLRAQLVSARKELRLAEDGLSAMESRSGLRVLQSELTSQKTNLAALFANAANLQNAGESIRGLDQRLRRLPPGTRADAVDDAGILVIQSGILAASVPGQLPSDSHTTVAGEQIFLPGTPLQLQPLQLQVQQQADRTVASQLVSLEGIASLIHDRTQGNARQIEGLRASVTELETRVAGILIEQGELLTQRDALRAYTRDLEAKVSQAKAILESGTARPRIVLEPRADPLPQASNTVRNSLLAGLVGLIVGVAAALGTVYYRAPQISRQAKPQPAVDQ